jgi:protease II
MTSGDLVWASDNAHLLYTVKDELDRPYKVLLHAVGANKSDEVVFEERDEVRAGSSSSSSSRAAAAAAEQQQSNSRAVAEQQEGSSRAAV